MSRNFSDFNFKEQPKQEKQSFSGPSEADLRSAYQEYSSLDPNALQARLASEIAQRKQDGTLDVEMLRSSVESIRAFLPYETYLNLKGLIENLK